RRRIFAGVDDKNDFVERLGKGLERTQCQCLAWALMSNHYHLLIRVSSQPLSKLMSPLLSGYATKYNRRKKRSGYVFQNRYQSILCDADNYLLELIRYIHLNPLKAGVVNNLGELERYRWTGHAGLMGNHIQVWQNREEVLELFGIKVKSAQVNYRKFIREGISEMRKMNYSGGGLVRSYGGWETVKYLRKDHQVRIGDERILGDSGFVEGVLKNDVLDISLKSQLQQKGWNLEYLVKKVCEYNKIKPCDLAQKGRQNKISIAKCLISYWGTQRLGLSATEIAQFLGVSQPSISMASKKGAEYCQQQSLDWGDVLNS
ncbi:MAG: transposase, partial [Thiohalomonadales bacterium]